MRIMPIKTWEQKRGRKARGMRRGSGRLLLAFLAALLVVSVIAVFWFTSAYYVHKAINRAALQAAESVAKPSVYGSADELLYGAPTGNLSASAVFANFVAPVLKAAHLNPKKVTKYSEQVTWLDPTDPKPVCGVIVYFEYPLTIHIPFTHSSLTLFQLKAAAQMPAETQSASGTC